MSPDEQATDALWKKIIDEDSKRFKHESASKIAMKKTMQKDMRDMLEQQI